MVIATSWVSVGYGSEEGTGGTPLKVESASDDSIFFNRGGRSARGVSGKFIPDVWETPLWGDARARGAHGKPRSPVGRRGLPSAPLGGAGGLQAASKQRASNEQAGRQWKGAPWGAHGKGCARQAPKTRRA